MRELEIAQATARKAGDIAARHWKKGIAKFEAKPDHSPVTAADCEAEQAIGRILEEAFPEDGILGEEGSAKQSRNGRRWIIDPVDGTRDFIRGEPGWAVLMGLEDQGEVIAGVCYFPALDEMFWASRGGGAFLNGSSIRASAIKEPSDAVLCLSGITDAARLPFAPRLLDWTKQFWAVRSKGGCVDAIMVARGRADLWVQPKASPWDLIAFKVISEEAGARFFNFNGQSSIYGGNCIVCTPGLESAARDLLRNDSH